jgi:hypothetical protein
MNHTKPPDNNDDIDDDVMSWLPPSNAVDAASTPYGNEGRCHNASHALSHQRNNERMK